MEVQESGYDKIIKTGLSAKNANPSIPDMSPIAQAKHAKHLQPGKSYPGMPMNEYVRKSSELARQKVGGDIDGYKCSDGAIVRYNKNTHDWVKAYETGVATMFIPRDKTNYYNRQKSIDGGV